MRFSFYLFTLASLVLSQSSSVSQERSELCSLQPIYDQVQCTRGPLKYKVLVLDKA